MIQNVYWLHVKYRYSCHILMKLEFFDKISNSSQTSNSLKIPSLGAEFFRVDEQMDRYEEANCRFSQFFEGA